LSAFDCQVPTLSPNFSKPSRTANSDLGIMQSKIYQFSMFELIHQEQTSLSIAWKSANRNF
jgi:hypothetical protein